VGTTRPPAAPRPLAAEVSLGAGGPAVPHSFSGLSIEYNELSAYEQAGPLFDRVVGLIRPADNSPILLRIGGKSADDTYWNTPTAAGAPPWLTEVGQAWLQPLGALVRRDGFHVMLDLNLAVHAPQMAASFAQAAVKALPAGALAGLAIGNEPDLYFHQPGLDEERASSTLPTTPTNWIGSYSPTAYRGDYLAYASALAAAVPGVRIAGPEIAAARPGWLQRLLPSLLGGVTQMPNAHASELVRRVDAEGELQIDEFTLEKLKFQHLRTVGALHDLHLDVREAEAQWAGGTVRAKIAARFLPRPAYEVTADLDRVDLAQLPAPARAAERFGGTASGTLHFTTQGVGRDELLEKLAGRGDVRMRNIEFRGWDVSASVSQGEPRTGESRWAAGEGAFTLRDKGVVLAGLRLESGREFTFVKGTVSFGRDANLTIQTTTDGRRESRTIEPGHILKISGPLDLPRVSVERTKAQQPAD